MSADLHPTVNQICAMHGISRRMYFNALTVRRNGCEELFNLVRDGASHALAEIDGVMWAGSVRQVLSCPPSTEMLRNISILVDSPVDRLESSTNISCKI